MSEPLIIYHGNCPDGFTAAWVAARHLGKAELFVGTYGEDPPYDLARGRYVYVVDFSYPRTKLEALKEAALELVVLDHHKTAEADLSGLPYCTFDMNRSGAGLAWDYFHPGQPRPWVVDYVEDRDLWRFKLPNSEELSLRIRLAEHTLEAWDALAAAPMDSLMSEAKGALLYLKHYVRDALRNLYVIDDADGTGTRMACVNCTYTGVSDVLNAALEQSGEAIALGWQRTSDGSVNCSLRSKPGVDCSTFAKRFGGGGHAQAAGFRLPVNSTFAAWLQVAH